METTFSKVRVTGNSLNGGDEQQLVDEVMGSGYVSQDEFSESTESGADGAGHESISSPAVRLQGNNEGAADTESGFASANNTDTSYEDVEGWQPKSATESENDPEAEPVLDASFGSIDPENSQEFFGALLPLLGGVVKAAAPSLIGAAAQYAPKVIKKVLGKKPKLPSGILNTLKSFNVPSGILKMLESGEYAEDFADTEFGESSDTADSLQQQIDALEVVIGVDDRVRVTNTTIVPWKRICHLKITAANGRSYLGTGFFIGPRTIVTAGHCVYLHNEGGWAKNIVVSPGRNAGSTPFNSFTSANFRSVKGWVNNRDRNFDYGVILLSKSDNVPASVGSFGFGNFADASLLSSNLNTAGYPGDKPAGTMWFHGRKAKSLNSRTITYEMDTAGGQSGSPVWIRRGEQRIAVGIHTNGASSGNSATRICAPVFANLQKWRIEGGSL